MECLKEFKYCTSSPGSLCSRIVNFCRAETGLTSKWGRILSAVYWCHQIQSTYILGCHATSYSVAGKLTDYINTHAHTLPKDMILTLAKPEIVTTLAIILCLRLLIVFTEVFCEREQ